MNNEDETFDALKNPPTEDEVGFGRKVRIYCDQHMRPHMTGWCTVSNRSKLKLAATSLKEAYAECRANRRTLFGE